jgi:hypothetical protein
MAVSLIAKLEWLLNAASMQSKPSAETFVISAAPEHLGTAMDAPHALRLLCDKHFWNTLSGNLG